MHFAYDLPLLLADINTYQAPAFCVFAAVNLVQCLCGLIILIQRGRGDARPRGARATGLALWLLVPALVLGTLLTPDDPQNTPMTNLEIAALLIAAASHPGLMGGEIIWRGPRRRHAWSALG